MEEGEGEGGSSRKPKKKKGTKKEDKKERGKKEDKKEEEKKEKRKEKEDKKDKNLSIPPASLSVPGEGRRRRGGIRKE